MRMNVKQEMRENFEEKNGGSVDNLSFKYIQYTPKAWYFDSMTE